MVDCRQRRRLCRETNNVVSALFVSGESFAELHHGGARSGRLIGTEAVPLMALMLLGALVTVYSTAAPMLASLSLMLQTTTAAATAVATVAIGATAAAATTSQRQRRRWPASTQDEQQSRWEMHQPQREQLQRQRKVAEQWWWRHQHQMMPVQLHCGGSDADIR